MTSPTPRPPAPAGQRQERRDLHIAILSFDRPAYLEEVLASLRQQLTPADRCYLFQDGAWNPISGRRWADEAVIVACVDIFQRMIPSGRAFVSSANLGVAGNYRRAEEFIFSALNADEALFLEDDLVLSPHYLRVTADLLDFAHRDADIGYVSAYGDLWATSDEQSKHEGRLQPMHENWGSALTRSSWMRQRPVREMYWQHLAHTDYRLRDSRRIVDLYRDLGLRLYFGSQDASRWAACAVAGLVRITTRTCHARYIGEHGIHEVPGRFETYAFARSVWFPSRPRLEPPSSAQIRQWLDEQQSLFATGYSHSYVRAARRDLVGMSDRALLGEAARACSEGDFAQAKAALERGLQQFPQVVDATGHPVFRKEFLRLLADLRAWDEVDRFLSRFGDWEAHAWHDALLARARADA